jgi:RimJ/RimL family protein N-acetyltransferase
VTDVRLEPFAAAHLDAMTSLLADPEVLRFARVPSPLPDGFLAAWLERYDTGRAEGTRAAFAAVDAGSGELLGIGVAPVIDAATRTVELGYMVAPEARGRGVARATLRALSDWALDELGAQRLELLIAVDNEPSKRVAERCGYVREGVLRSYFFKQDLRQDTEIWSLLPSDRAR